MPTQRRPTQPQRRFTPEALAALNRDARRKLVQVLLTETGSRVVEVHRPAGYDELILETRPLWRPRRLRVRIAARAAAQDDVDRLAEAVETAGDAEGMLLTPLGTDGPLQPPATILVIDANELIARMERCTSIAWPDRQPVPAYERVAAQRDLERDAFLLDPAGLRWLPTLALNELPAARCYPFVWLERVGSAECGTCAGTRDHVPGTPRRIRFHASAAHAVLRTDSLSELAGLTRLAPARGL